MVKSKKSTKGAKPSKASSSTSLNQSRISFAQKTRVETAESRSKMESDDLDPIVNSDDSVMEEVETLPVDEVFSTIDPSRWNLQYLSNICTIRNARARRDDDNKILFGNSLFSDWDDDPDFHWPWCEGYLELFSDPPTSSTWEREANELLKASNGDWTKVESNIKGSLDFSLRDDFVGKELEVVDRIRGLALGLAVQDPLVIFPLTEVADPTTFCNRYWDFTAEDDPLLLLEARPLAMVWALASTILGHPWVDPATTTVPSECAERQQSTLDRKRDRDGDDLANRPAPVDPRSPDRGYFPEAVPKPVQERPPNDDVDMSDSEHPAAVIISPPGKLLDPNQPTKQLLQYFSDDESASDSEGDFPPPVGHQRQADKPPSEVVLGDPSATPTRLMNDPSVTVLNSTDDPSLKRPSPPPDPPRLKKNLTYADAAKKKASYRAKYLSEEIKAKELTQMRLDGLPGTNAQFLCVTINYEWDGDTTSGGSIENSFTEDMVAVLSMAMENAEKDLVILPVSELRVRSKRLWLRTKEEVEALTFKTLKPYIDLNWNNGAKFGYNAKSPGTKTLRTRIRVAHDSSSEEMSRLLGECFSTTGANAGVYRSPLQVGDPVRIGWLLNYPMGISRPALERELMRHFGFKIAIALEPSWPQQPGTSGQKWVPTRGPKAWHVWVAAADVDTVAKGLFLWLSPSTKKCHMPFGARTQFVFSWEAVSKNRLGQLADPGTFSPVIAKLINTHDTSAQTCAILSPQFPLQGMLTKVFVPKYCKQGKTKSLLHFLYAIQCIPAARKKAPPITSTGPAPPSGEAQPATPGQSSPPESAAAVAPRPKRPPRTKSMEKPKSPPSDSAPVQPPGTKQPSSASPPGSSEITTSASAPSARAKLTASEALPAKDFDRGAWLAAMDAELNSGPAGLFQMILPSPIHGFYVFVVRKKFESLAKEVLKNLAAFLISYLELWKDLTHQRKTCRTWLCLDHYNRTVSDAMTWDQATHRAQSEYDRNVELHEQVEKDDNGWIERLLEAEQSSETFKGTLVIDLSMPAARDMDDGATVASAAKLAVQLEAMKADVSDLCGELETATSALESSKAKSEAQDARIRELEAMMSQQQLAKGRPRGTSPCSSSKTNSADSGGGPPTGGP